MRFLNYAAAAVFCLFLAKAGLAQVVKQVDCTKGKTITEAASKLDPAKEYVIEVSGTCNENVAVENFEGISLQIIGTPSATVVGFTASPQVPAVRVLSSRRVRLSNLTVLPADTVNPGIGNAGGINLTQCRGCTLDGLTVTTDRQGIIFFDSQGTVANTNITMTANGTALAVVGLSDVNLVNYEATGSASFSNAAIIVDQGSRARLNYSLNSPKTFQKFLAAIQVRNGGTLEGPSLCGGPSPAWTPCLTVTNNRVGMRVTAGQVTQMVGVDFNGNGDGIIAESGSVVQGGPLINVRNSNNAGFLGAAGVGILATHNSHVSIGAFNLTQGPANDFSGNQLRGVAVAGSSSVQFGGLDADNANNVTGTTSGTDIACDATSLVSGTNTIPGGAVIACANQNAATAPIP
jgi:hypothetical protein